MSFSNVRLILAREVRDQLRDRRTLFMMFVLPILLYPLLGMSLIQARQFMHEKPVKVLVMGARELVDSPPLFDRNKRFSPDLFGDPQDAKLLELDFAGDEPEAGRPKGPDLRAQARRAVQSGQYDAVLFFPETFSQALESFQRRMQRWAEQADSARLKRLPRIPRPEVIYTTANDKSQIAKRRLDAVWDRWNDRFLEANLAAAGVPPLAARPLELDPSDVAGDTPYRSAALWSKVLPVLLLLWALTGAFYPAIDLCAGEKERGTLETLLCSPAERSEIVLGKLLTIMLFSMATAVLNLASVGVTGWMVFGGRPEFALPPPLAFLWLGVALVAVSALFSALCLALAAFARSSKEGQYYLVPLLLLTMPLVVLPMTPSVELNLGNSLVPVSGLVLLLRSLLEGAYWPALQFLPVVVAVTAAACLLSIRWAVGQFNSESVLFREGERLDVRLWLRHLVRDRQPTPTLGAAVFCVAVILLGRFCLGVMMTPPTDFGSFVTSTLISQLTVFAAPALVMALLLTSSPPRTLLLRRPPWAAIPAAAALAVLLHPAINVFQIAVQQLYPVGKEAAAALEQVQEMINSAPLWQLVLVIALTPAICEELAFRGFILSGLRHLGHRWRAIIYSALLFGLAHLILQQTLVACVLGIVIGYLAVQSGSLWPAMTFHLVHNGLVVCASRVVLQSPNRQPLLRHLISPVEGGYVCPWPTVVVASLLALPLLYWFSRLAYPKSPEEDLQEAIRQKASEEDD